VPRSPRGCRLVVRLVAATVRIGTDLLDRQGIIPSLPSPNRRGSSVAHAQDAARVQFGTCSMTDRSRPTLHGQGWLGSCERADWPCGVGEGSPWRLWQVTLLKNFAKAHTGQAAGDSSSGHPWAPPDGSLGGPQSRPEQWCVRGRQGDQHEQPWHSRARRRGKEQSRFIESAGGPRSLSVLHFVSSLFPCLSINHIISATQRRPQLRPDSWHPVASFSLSFTASLAIFPF
jgi:hypothetical protein